MDKMLKIRFQVKHSFSLVMFRLEITRCFGKNYGDKLKH